MAGLALQLTMGPMDWSRLSAPVNWIVLGLLLGVLFLMFLFRRKVYAFEWMMHRQAAVTSIAWALGITLVMGLLPQTREGGVPWLSQMLTFWPFVLVWTWMMVISGLAALNHLLHFRLSEIPFLLNHLGVFVAIVAATLGSADVQKLQMTVSYENPEWRALSDEYEVVEPGFTIELHAEKFFLKDGVRYYRTGDMCYYAEDGNLMYVSRKDFQVKINGFRVELGEIEHHARQFYQNERRVMALIAMLISQ